MNINEFNHFLDAFGYKVSTDGKDKKIILPKINDIRKLSIVNKTSLISVIIPDGVISIGNYTFANCESLESITIPDSVTYIGRCAFFVCKSLKSIIIPNGVTSIGDWVFAGCRSLTSIAIPDSVININKDVFYNCSPDLTIYGKSGSYAEEYATKNNIKFRGV